MGGDGGDEFLVARGGEEDWTARRARLVDKVKDSLVIRQRGDVEIDPSRQKVLHMRLAGPQREDEAKQRGRIAADPPEQGLEQQIRFYQRAVEVDDERLIVPDRRVGLNRCGGSGRHSLSISSNRSHKIQSSSCASNRLCENANKKRKLMHVGDQGARLFGVGAREPPVGSPHDPTPLRGGAARKSAHPVPFILHCSMKE